jgi:hypothetical protein
LIGGVMDPDLHLKYPKKYLKIIKEMGRNQGIEK